MKKLPFNKKFFTICLYIFLTAAAIIVFNKMINASDNLFTTIRSAFSFIIRLLTPFITAVIMAYLLNPAVKLFERLLSKVFKKDKRKKLRRGLSITLVYLLLLGIIFILIYFTVPQVIDNVADLINSLPQYYTRLMEWLTDISEKYEILGSSDFIQEVTDFLYNMRTNIFNMLNTALQGITSWVGGVVSSVLNFFLGFIMSIYLLIETETVGRGFGNFVQTLIGGKRYRALHSFIREVDTVFSRFISAKLLEIIYMYIIAQIAFALLGIPYHALMAVIVAVTNLIPYIGPYLGGAAPMMLALMDDPIKALYVLIVLIVMQVLDNNVLSPIVIGDKVGLSPFWVMMATLLFGGLFGLVGMVLAAPLAAVFNILLQRFLAWYRKYQKKRLTQLEMEDRPPNDPPEA